MPFASRAGIVILFACCGIANADWVDHYPSDGFSGGGPRCAIEFDGMLAIGGDFESAGCEFSPGIVLCDFQSFHAVGDGLWALSPYAIDDFHIEALSVLDGALVAGGYFQQIDGSANVARWDGQSWEPLGHLRSTNHDETEIILDLVVFDGSLIAVGNFDINRRGETLQGVARFDGYAWLPLGTRPQGAEALAVYQGELYCGLSKWDGSQWNPIGAMGSYTSRVTTLDVVDAGLAIGGTFYEIDGQECLGAAIYDGVTLEQFGNGVWTIEDWAWPEAWPAGVAAFASHEGISYALAPQAQHSYEGWFGLSQYDDPDRPYWWPVDGIVCEDWYGVLGGDLLSIDGRLVVLSGTDAGHLVTPTRGPLEAAVWDGSTWEPIATGLGLPEPPIAVEDLLGQKFVIDHQRNLLRQSGSNFAGRSGAYLTGGVYSLIHAGDRLLASGTSVYFHHFPEVFPELRWIDAEGSSPVCLPTAYPVGFTDGIGRSRLWGDGFLTEYLCIAECGGGPFSTPNSLYSVSSDCEFTLVHVGDSRPFDDFLVHQDEAWFARDGELYRLTGPRTGEMTPVLMGTFNQTIHALVSAGSRLYVGGEFHSVNGMTSPHLAVYDGNAWIAPPSVDGPVHALAASEDGLVVLGGSFAHIGGDATSNLALLKNGATGVFPDGPDGRVTSVAVTESGLIVGGDFTAAGGHCSVHVAEWIGDLNSLSMADPDTPPPGDEVVVERLRFHAPYPNPFNPSVTLSFDLPRAGSVELRIYDVSGRRVRTIASRNFDAGTHELRWDGKDDFGNAVAAGMYVGRLASGLHVAEQKLTLVK